MFNAGIYKFEDLQLAGIANGKWQMADGRWQGGRAKF
jgi:hypothetical protein